MGDFPLLGGFAEVKWYPDFSVASSYYANPASAGTANTKGTYQELTSSTPFDAYGISIEFIRGSGAADYLVDIATGAASSEVDIISHLIYGQQADSYHLGCHYFFPLFIPSGVRLATRCQCTNATSRAVSVKVGLYKPGILAPQPAQRVTTYGASTGDSGGTEVDPGGSADTKNSTWSQITSSTSLDHVGFCLGIGNQNNSARASGLVNWAVDVGIGSASSEENLISDFGLCCHDTINMVQPQTSPFFPIMIPSGTRVAATAACDITDTTDRKFDMVIYALS